MVLFIENIHKILEMYFVVKGRNQKRQSIDCTGARDCLSVFKHLPIEKMVASESGYNVFSPGSTYIVLDAGGKLIFIFLYEHLLTIFIGYLKLKSIWAFPRSYFERIRSTRRFVYAMQLCSDQ